MTQSTSVNLPVTLVMPPMIGIEKPIVEWFGSISNTHWSSVQRLWAISMERLRSCWGVASVADMPPQPARPETNHHRDD